MFWVTFCKVTYVPIDPEIIKDPVGVREPDILRSYAVESRLGLGLPPESATID